MLSLMLIMRLGLLVLYPPVPRPHPVGGRRPNILRITWSNLMKTDGKRKCRACIDGS
jgi:hypothetical protein